LTRSAGIEDNVKSLNDRVGILEKNLDEMRALVNVLNQNVEGKIIIRAKIPKKLVWPKTVGLIVLNYIYFL